MNLAGLANVPEKCKFQHKIQILCFTHSSVWILSGLLINEFGPKGTRKAIKVFVPLKRLLFSISQDPRERAESNNQVLCVSLPGHQIKCRSAACYFSTNCSHCMFGLVKPSDWRRGFWVMLNVFPHMSKLLICQILEKSLNLFSFYIYLHTSIIEMVVCFCDIIGWRAIINNNYKFSLGNRKIQSSIFVFFLGALHISACLKSIIFPQKAKVCKCTLFTAVCMPDAWHIWGVSVRGIECPSCGPWAENHFTLCLSWFHSNKNKKEPTISFRQQFIHFRKKKII